jgi:hypothetical protein
MGVGLFAAYRQIEKMCYYIEHQFLILITQGQYDGTLDGIPNR